MVPTGGRADARLSNAIFLLQRLNLTSLVGERYQTETIRNSIVTGLDTVGSKPKEGKGANAYGSSAEV